MKARAPNVLLCMLLLAAVDLSLRMFGFRRTARWSRRLTRSKGPASEAELVGKTIHRLLTATAFYPGRSKCLEQSIAGFVLLRRRGFDVRLRLGVQPYPFSAHAWLELEGQPITESAERIAGFVIMPEVAI